MKKTYISVFVTLLAVYVALAFTLPTDPQVLSKHGITQAQSRLLNLTIVVPLVLIYLSALYGFLRVNDYAEKVRETKEGPYFKQLSIGLMVLAFTLPLNSIMGSLTSYIRHAQPHFISDISIIRQYSALLLAFLAIYFISKGAQGLHSTLKNKQPQRDPAFYWLLGPTILSAVYTWLLVSQTHHSPDGSPYHLPEWLVVTTIAIPYIFIWCVGAWAAVYLYKYHVGVKGVIYKRAIAYLAKGIAAIIVISILLQSLTTLSGLLNRLDLTPLLLIIYLLIALYALGYGMVARGANKLKQIEEA